MAVMSIDMGSEWLKIAIVKAGVPMEIALNTESSRKTSNVVSMKGKERLFSDPAAKVAIKNPSKAFIYLTHLIGKKFDSDPVKTYKERFPYAKLLKDEVRGTVLFEGEDGSKYSVEQLLGMIFNSSRQIAERFADHPMKHAVITVPVYFNQAERRAVLLAANLTGLNVLQLMNDNTAVALNYGIFRSAAFNTSVQHVMFFDMGASHATATVVGYSTTKVKDRGYVETVPQMVVKGVGFDVKLGGLEMDLRLRDHLVKMFKASVETKGDITESPRSMAKLLKEAHRVRQVLSANPYHKAQVEGLFEDKDFKVQVTREELDTMCADLYARVEKSVKMALSASAIPKEEIESVILMGGATRIPKVQELLKAAMGKEELAKNINTDEAAALGSVYRAADLTNGFKVKRFLIKDLNLFPIDVSFERKSSTPEGETRWITRNLFSRLNPVPQRKVMTFNKKLEDFSFNVSYGDMSFLTEELRVQLNLFNVSSVQLTGVAEANKKNEKATPKGVKAYFNLDESALLHLEKVEAHFEKTPELVKQEEAENQSTLSKIGSTLSSFFGNKDKESDESVEENKDEPSESKADEGSEKSTKEEPKTEEKKEETNKEDKKEEKPKTEEKQDEIPKPKEDNKEDSKNGTEPTADEKLKTNATAANVTDETANKTEAKPVAVKELVAHSVEFIDQLSLDKAVFDASSKVLDELEARDKAKLAREQAMNDFESYVVHMRAQMHEDEISELLTDEEKEPIQGKLSEAYNWFDEDGWDADTETLVTKLKELQVSMEDLQYKITEASERPRVIAAMLGSLNMTDYFIKSYKSLPDSKDIFTEKDIKDALKIYDDTKNWFMTTWKKQNETLASAKPVLITKEVESNQAKLDRELVYLMNKVRYYVPKPKPTPTANKTKASNTTKSDDKKSVPTNETKPDEATSKSTSEEAKVDPAKDESTSAPVEGEKDSGKTTEAPGAEEIPVLELPSTDKDTTNASEEKSKAVPKPEDEFKPSTHEPGEL